MANRKVYEVKHRKSECQLLTQKLTGNGANALVNAELSNMGGGEVQSIVRNSAGNFTFTFKATFPEVKWVAVPCCVGTTSGLVGQFTTFDPVTNNTATLVLSVAGTPTDPATTDTIYLEWLVRNSNFNK